MHIPERYRDRYDRLALSHPWMREMRDKTTNGIDHEVIREIIERHFGKVAVIDDGGDTVEWREGWVCKIGIDYTAIAEEINALPTNVIDGETNGIAADSPLVDGDAVAILRKAASYDGDYSSSSEALRRLTDSTTVYFALEKLADMVERDYVRKDDYVFTVEMLKCMTAERDEAIEAYDKHIEAHDAWHEPEDIQYTRNRFSILEKAKNERIAKLEAERDEWKAKYLGAMNDVDDYKTLWMCSREGSTKSAKRAAAVERLRNFEPRWAYDLFDALLDGERSPTNWKENRDTLIDLLTDEPMDANGVASDDCGHSTDMSQKDADFVREGGEMSGNRASATFDNLGENVTHDSRECAEPTRVDDTRAELDADIRAWCLLRNLNSEIVTEFCDRAAAIVEVERNRHWMEIVGANASANAELKRQIDALTVRAVGAEQEADELTAIVDRLKRESDELQAAYDELTRIAAELCRACGFEMVDASGEVIA